MANLAARIFVWVGRIAAHLPAVKGKNGVFLRLFNFLGLKPQHIFVDAVLRAPIRYRARLDLHSWLQRLAYVSGEYEANTVRFLVKVHEGINKPGYVLDVGANIGLIGIPTALTISTRNKDRSSKPYVICVEAVQDNEKALRHNVALNDAQEDISIIGTGLGEVESAVDIQVEGDLKSGEGTGTANILPAGSTLDPNGRYECVRIPIQITTLDTLMCSGVLREKCAVIKIDTDGYDLKILKGGRDFLNQNRPVIYGEFASDCLKWHGESITDVVVFASSINYFVWPRLPGKEIKFTRAIDANSYSQDLMMVPAEYASDFAWCCQN